MRDTAGWLIRKRLAASVIEPVSQTATKICSERRSNGIS